MIHRGSCLFGLESPRRAVIVIRASRAGNRQDARSMEICDAPFRIRLRRLPERIRGARAQRPGTGLVPEMPWHPPGQAIFGARLGPGSRRIGFGPGTPAHDGLRRPRLPARFLRRRLRLRSNRSPKRFPVPKGRFRTAALACPDPIRQDLTVVTILRKLP